MSTPPCIVLKFGGASVSSPDSFHKIAQIIIDRHKHSQVVVVVSAMGDTTDELIALAHSVHPHPPRRELDMLISTGERTSIALLAMALAYAGAQAISFTGSQSGILTTADHADARIVDVKPHRLITNLNEGKIVIVAGFQGVSQESREITTLGRGGSDTTAVALGIALKASRVEFFKDVPGVFDKDPKESPDAKLLSELSYEDALDLMEKGAQVLHARSVSLAQKNNIPLVVLPFTNPHLAKGIGTYIGPSMAHQARPEAQYESTT